jgi:hypothetical protein
VLAELLTPAKRYKQKKKKKEKEKKKEGKEEKKEKKACDDKAKYVLNPGTYKLQRLWQDQCHPVLLLLIFNTRDSAMSYQVGSIWEALSLIDPNTEKNASVRIREIILPAQKKDYTLP